MSEYTLMKTADCRFLFSVSDIEALTGGKVPVRGSRGIDAVSIDSRMVAGLAAEVVSAEAAVAAGAGTGALFVPLPGSRVDGHQFLAAALEAGAAAVLCAEREWAGKRHELDPLLRRYRASVVVVDDPLEVLQILSRNYLKERRVHKIGITGSNGKTTTKEILGAILAEQDETVINAGNLNSEIGLPLSVFRVKDEHRYAVFEMGVNHRGEMDILADILRPDYALITNIGSAHIGLLGSRAAIAEEKRKIFRYFDGRQTAFLPEEEEYFRFLSEEIHGKVVAFGKKSTKGYEGSESLGLDGSAIDWEGLQIHFPFFGEHNLENALASISVSVELGISKNNIKKGLESVKPLFGRSQILKGELTIIQDCYNANPDSVRLVIDFFRNLSWPGRKILVLGSMLELGAESDEAHYRIGTRAAESGADLIFLFGKEMERAQKALEEQVFGGQYEWTADYDRMRRRLDAYVRAGDLVVLKGSRAVELERLVPDLSERPDTGRRE